MQMTGPSWRAGAQFNQKVRAVVLPQQSTARVTLKGPTPSVSALPATQALLTLNTTTAWATALKKEWTGNGVVVRVFDVAGTGSVINGHLAVPVRALAHCDIIELNCRNSSSPQLSLPVGKYAIETFRLDVGL